MLKNDFLRELQNKLSGLPQEDVEERLNFYSEMIDDRMEEGLSEEEAVAQIASTDDIFEETVADIPLSRILKKRFSADRRLSPWVILLLVLGSPIWLSLLIAFIAVVFSVYVVLWSAVISLWAVEASLVASVIGVLVGAVFFIIKGYALTGIALIGASLFVLGLSVFFCYGCKMATLGIVLLTKKITLFIKSMFLRKEKDR